MHLRFRISFLIIIFQALLQPVGAQPEVKVSGPYQVRPGFGTGVSITIVRKGISGPVRFTQTIPGQWRANALPPYTCGLEQTGNKIHLTWLNFPLTDTVKVMFDLVVSKNTPIGEITELGGELEYLEGNSVRRISAKPHKIKTVKYYSIFQ